MRCEAQDSAGARVIAPLEDALWCVSKNASVPGGRLYLLDHRLADEAAMRAAGGTHLVHLTPPQQKVKGRELPADRWRRSGYCTEDVLVLFTL